MAVTQAHDRDGARSLEKSEPPVLWHLKVSHYNEKVRWALDHKRVAHIRRAVHPGAHSAIALQLTGGRTFPVLVLDGRALGDSTAIIAALERRYPEPALYPPDAGARRRALEIEDYFDEQLGPHLRLLVISRLLTNGKLMLGTFFPDLERHRELVARAVFPLHRRRAIAAFEIDASSIETAWSKVRAADECFQEELQPSGYLVGDRFTVADLTLAALVAPAIAPEQFPYPQPQRGHPLLADVRDALAGSGLLAWAHEMYARHRGHSAEMASP